MEEEEPQDQSLDLDSLFKALSIYCGPSDAVVCEPHSSPTELAKSTCYPQLRSEH